MIELDVHGLTVEEALRTFVDFYNRRVKTGSREELRVVHGWVHPVQAEKSARS